MSELVVPDFDGVTEMIKPFQEPADLSLKLAQSIVLSPATVTATPDLVKWTNDLLLSTKQMIESTKESKSIITSPARAFIANTDTLFGHTLRTYEKIEIILKEKLANFDKLVSAQREIEAKAGLQVTLAPVELEGTRFEKTWKFEVFEEDAVPRSLCTSDDKKIRALLVKTDDPSKLSVPGVKFFEHTKVVSSKKGVKGK